MCCQSEVPERECWTSRARYLGDRAIPNQTRSISTGAHASVYADFNPEGVTAMLPVHRSGLLVEEPATLCAAECRVRRMSPNDWRALAMIERLVFCSAGRPRRASLRDGAAQSGAKKRMTRLQDQDSGEHGMSTASKSCNYGSYKPLPVSWPTDACPLFRHPGYFSHQLFRRLELFLGGSYSL